MTEQEAFDRLCRARHYDAGDFEKAEDWECFRLQLLDILHSFLHRPIREAYQHARDMGWADKHIIHILHAVVDE